MTETKGGLGRERIPDGYSKHKRTPTFTKQSLPEALKQNHAIKAGVWGLIDIEQGRILYTISGDEESSLELDPQTPGIVAPGEHHHVRILDDDTRFHVAFYRKS